MNRAILLTVCAAVLLTACAAPVYVRKFDPTTPADSAKVYADSLVWQVTQKHEADNRIMRAVVFGLVYFLIILPATIALTR